MKKETFKDFMKPGRKVWVTHRNWWGDPIGSSAETIANVEVYDCNDDVVSNPDDWKSWMDCHVETEEYGTYDKTIGVDFTPVYTLADCDDDDLRKIFHEISHGSMYKSDYNNSLNVDPDQVYDADDGYTEELYEDYGDDWTDHLTEESFVEYCKNCA